MRTASEGEAGRHLRTLLESGEIGGLPDGRLLERFVAGDGATAEAAFAELVDRHGPMVWRACRSILADPNDADDAFQATFLVMVRRSRSLGARESLGPWLLQVARRTSLRARSLAMRRRVLEFMAAGLKPRLRVEPPPDELVAAIHEEVGRLPERYREVAVLCLLEGLTDSQAATRLRWPLGTVHSRLARGREKLRRGLTRRGFAPAVAALASSRTPTEAASAAVPERLIEATVRSASRLASLGLRDAALPASVAALTEGVLRMTWVAKIQSTILAVAALGGVAVAATLAAPGPASQEPGPHPSVVEQEKLAPPAVEPNAFATCVVDVEIRSAGRPDDPARGLGTVIASTPEASFVLTSLRGAEIVAGPSGGRSQIRGEIRVGGVGGESIDVEPSRGLALIRFRPGRIVPAARVVARDRVLTIGQELALVERLEPGRDATTRPVRILELAGTEPEQVPAAGPPGVLFIVANGSPTGPNHEGAGLFLKGTDDAHRLEEVAGVFRFAPNGQNGVFIGPEAIHRLLDRNSLGRHADPTTAPPSPPGLAPPSVKVEESATAAILASTVGVIAFDGHEPGSRSQAAGTVISSTPDRSLVLTCAHIILGGAADAPGGRKVMETIRVVLDAKDSPQGSFEAEAIQVDEDRDLAVLRIRPGAVIPGARIAPPSRRLVVNAPALRLDRRDPDHDRPLEVMPTTIVALDRKITNRGSTWTSCTGAPKPGVSGGGLYDAHPVAGGESPILVGLCNYADPAADRGFYASPDMIYATLDEAGLSALYRDEAWNAPPPEIAGSELVKQGFVALAVEGAATPIALGTVISSSEEESIVLTAGSIFAGAGEGPVDPKRFGRKVTVYHARPRTEHSVPVPPIWGTAGEVVDFDEERNVGLVRFRPGYRLAALGVVPPSWKPTRGGSVLRFLNLTVNDDPAAIREPSVLQRIGEVDYEAIECEGAPARTNVGAPLIVTGSDERSSAIAGVCNYSSPHDAAGYYAAPAMIYHILDANGLSHLYRKGNEAFGLAPPPPLQTRPAGPGRSAVREDGSRRTPNGRNRSKARSGPRNPSKTKSSLIAVHPPKSLCDHLGGRTGHKVEVPSGHEDAWS